MPRDIKTIPTSALKFEAKIYLGVGVAAFALSTLAFLARGVLSEALALGIFFLGNMLGFLFIAIGVAFFVAAWFRPKGWVPEWTLKGEDPTTQVQKWARALEADHPGWVASQTRWEPFPAPSPESLWKEGWKGFRERFLARMEPLVWVHKLCLELVHRDGRKVDLTMITGRSRDQDVPVVGGVLMEAFVPKPISGTVKFSWNQGWELSDESDLQWLSVHREALGGILDRLLNHRYENVAIPEALLVLLPRDGGFDALVHTLPRETNGGFGRSLGTREFLDLVERLEAAVP